MKVKKIHPYSGVISCGQSSLGTLLNVGLLPCVRSSSKAGFWGVLSALLYIYIASPLLAFLLLSLCDSRSMLCFKRTTTRFWESFPVASSFPSV